MATQASDISGVKLSMYTPLVSSSVLSNPATSIGDSLVSSSNQTTSILSGSHHMTNPVPIQEHSYFLVNFKATSPVSLNREGAL